MSEAKIEASVLSAVVRPEEFPPVPSQLLWMFDGIDRKEATKMMHEYAQTAITWKPSKALREAWERAQQAEDKARRLEDENERLRNIYGTAIARVIDSDDFAAEVSWILNPLPAGTLLYEGPNA